MNKGRIDGFALARFSATGNTFWGIAYLSVFGDDGNRFFAVLNGKTLGMSLIFLMAALCFVAVVDVVLNDWGLFRLRLKTVRRWRSSIYMALSLCWAAILAVMVESGAASSLYPLVVFNVAIFVFISIVDICLIFEGVKGGRKNKNADLEALF